MEGAALLRIFAGDAASTVKDLRATSERHPGLMPNRLDARLRAAITDHEFACKRRS